MTQLGRFRLQMLADHLEFGKLGHEKFDFSTWNQFDGQAPESRNVCGTSGCAVGECPIVFPRNWTFDNAGDPVLRTSINVIGMGSEPIVAAQEFFDLNKYQANGLFLPSYFRLAPWNEGRKFRKGKPDRRDVARAIWRFLKYEAKQAASMEASA